MEKAVSDAKDDPAFAVPSGEVLAREGVFAPRRADAAERVMLIGCGALAGEVQAICRLNGWTMFDLDCLPALLHNRPERIPSAVRMRARAARARGYDRIFVLYADCGCGRALDAVCVEEGISRIDAPHCYALYGGVDFVLQDGGEEADDVFYLTDFLARHFEILIWRGLALDRHADLRELLFDHYEKVIYLAQGEDPEVEELARAAARRLGLEYERRFTGYGGLETTLARFARGA